MAQFQQRTGSTGAWVLPGARVSTVAFGASPWRHGALLAGCLLALEVAVVVQVAVHEAVVGLRDSLGSRVPQEPHGFERSSTLSCPLLPFPDAVARRPLAVGKDGAVPEWIWERSQRNSIVHCALMDTGATAGPSQSPYCR